MHTDAPLILSWYLISFKLEAIMDKFIKQQTPISQSHHMAIPWQSLIQNDKQPAKDASLPERASIVGRIGIQMLSCGTGAWRVRDAMNKIARKLDLSCSADIGLINLTYTCFSDGHSYTQQLSLPNTGVNTDKLNTLENFVKHIGDTFFDVNRTTGSQQNQRHSKQAQTIFAYSRWLSSCSCM
jgi:uncharacterized membrane protein YjjP (DUF1212 family)